MYSRHVQKSDVLCMFCARYPCIRYQHTIIVCTHLHSAHSVCTYTVVLMSRMILLFLYMCMCLNFFSCFFLFCFCARKQWKRLTCIIKLCFGLCGFSPRVRTKSVWCHRSSFFVRENKSLCGTTCGCTVLIWSNCRGLLCEFEVCLLPAAGREDPVRTACNVRPRTGREEKQNDKKKPNVPLKQHCHCFSLQRKWIRWTGNGCAGEPDAVVGVPPGLRFHPLTF